MITDPADVDTVPQPAKPTYSGSSGLDRLTGDWTLECTEHGVIYRSADNTGNTAAWSAHCSTTHGKDSDRG